MEAVDTGTNTIVTAIAITMLVVGGFLLYIFPSIIALTRKHHNAPAIVALNLLAGWTFIGWVVAAVWSMTTPPRR